MSHLNIKSDDVHRAAKRLARLTGESLTQAVARAIDERLEREKSRRGRAGVADRLRKIGRRAAARPVLDDRTPDDIIGYDDRGLPT